MIKNKNSTEYNFFLKSIVNVKVPQAHGEGNKEQKWGSRRVKSNIEIVQESGADLSNK